MESKPNAAAHSRESHAKTPPIRTGIPGPKASPQDGPDERVPRARPARARRVMVEPQLRSAPAQAAPQPAVLAVEEAMLEITTVPAAAIHREAALQWGARAVASYRTCVARAELQECLSFFYLGEHYREAALAHAAMGEEWQPLHAEIDCAISADRATAFTAMRERGEAEA